MSGWAGWWALPGNPGDDRPAEGCRAADQTGGCPLPAINKKTPSWP